MNRIVVVLFLVGCAATQPGPSQGWIDNNLSEDPSWTDAPPTPPNYLPITTPRGLNGFIIRCISENSCVFYASRLCGEYVVIDLVSGAQECSATYNTRYWQPPKTTGQIVGETLYMTMAGMQGGWEAQAAAEDHIRQSQLPPRVTVTQDISCTTPYVLVIECLPEQTAEEDQIILEEE